MHKNIRLATAGAVLAAAASLTTGANAATTATAGATAEILSSINIVKDTDLDFGQIAVNGAGTVKIDTGATPADTCSANLVCAGTKTRAGFTVTGARNLGVLVTLPSSAVTLTGSGGGTMSLGSFTSYFPTGTTLTAASGTIGTTTIDVGGTLTVAAGQTTGVYTGSFDVSVAYN
jgi:hypothetical protein